MTEAQGASSFSAGAGVLGAVTRRGGGGAETICAPPNRPPENGGRGLSQSMGVIWAGSAVWGVASATILALPAGSLAKIYFSLRARSVPRGLGSEDWHKRTALDVSLRPWR